MFAKGGGRGALVGDGGLEPGDFCIQLGHALQGKIVMVSQVVGGRVRMPQVDAEDVGLGQAIWMLWQLMELSRFPRTLVLLHTQTHHPSWALPHEGYLLEGAMGDTSILEIAQLPELRQVDPACAGIPVFLAGLGEPQTGFQVVFAFEPRRLEVSGFLSIGGLRLGIVDQRLLEGLAGPQAQPAVLVFP